VDGFDHDRRGMFDGLRVPHSFVGIGITAVTLVVYTLGTWVLERMLNIPGDSHCRLLVGMLGNFSAHLGGFGESLANLGGWENRPTAYGSVTWILFIGWSLLMWAFLSGAVHRNAALQIAREEGLPFGEAVKFGFRKLKDNLLAVGLVFVIMGFFYFVANASIAGGLGRIPYVGDVLVGVLFVLVLVSTFFLVFATTLGVLGFNLSAAAIATEDSDTFDGVSRSWNYLLARPWAVLLTFAATFLYLGVVFFAGNHFIGLSVRSLSVGDWGMGRAARAIETHDLDPALRERLRLPETLDVVYVPGKADYIEGSVVYKRYRAGGDGRIGFAQGAEYAIERFREDVGRYPSDAEGFRGLIEDPRTFLAEGGEPGLENWRGPYLSGYPTDDHGNHYGYERTDRQDTTPYTLIYSGADGQLGTGDDERGAAGVGIGLGPKLDVAPLLESTLGFSRVMVNMWVNLLGRLLLASYMICYFLCAQTTLYFLLRRDVEGDPYTEVAYEEEEAALPFEYATAAHKAPTLPEAKTPETPKAGEGEAKEGEGEAKGDDKGDDEPAEA